MREDVNEIAAVCISGDNLLEKTLFFISRQHLIGTVLSAILETILISTIYDTSKL